MDTAETINSPPSLMTEEGDDNREISHGNRSKKKIEESPRKESLTRIDGGGEDDEKEGRGEVTVIMARGDEDSKRKKRMNEDEIVREEDEESDTSHVKDERGFVTVDISSGAHEANSKAGGHHAGSRSEHLLERIGEKASRYLPKRGSLGRLFGDREKPTGVTHHQGPAGDINVYTIDREMNKGKKNRPDRYARNPEILDRLRRTKQSPPPTDEATRCAGVQVSAYPPFRLYWLPQDDWREADSKLVAGGRLVCCLCGLGILYFVWVLVAALAIYLSEGPAELQRAADLNYTEVSLGVSLATDLQLLVTEDPVWRTTIERYLARHQAVLLEAARSGYSEEGPLWSYPGCLLYTVTLFSVLGFGSPSLQTVCGQVFAVFFVLTGVPLHFLLVRNLGVAIASKIHSAAKELDVKFKHLKRRLHKVRHSTGDEREVWPEEMFTPECSPPPRWVRAFPPVCLVSYYLLGVLLLGVCRWLPSSPPALGVFLYPLDFTAAGGLASTGGWARISYALFLEGAVVLAAANLAIVTFPGSRRGSLMSAALRWDLVTNSVD